jgi:hypothetical protein
VYRQRSRRRSLRHSLRSQVRTALAEVDDLIPAPWDLAVLIHRLADRRRRPIRLQAVPFPKGDVSGLWLPLSQEDLILYDRAASPTLKEQIIGHELGHMLMNHQVTAEGAAAPAAGTVLTASIGPDLVGRFLARTVYDNQIEAAAEEFGTRLLQTARRRRPRRTPDPLGRLTDSLR